MKPFSGAHPDVMTERVKSYTIDFNPSQVLFRPGIRDIRRRISNIVGKLTGWYPGEYKNYKALKSKM